MKNKKDIPMYWKHDKEILYSFNFDRIIFIKIHIHEQMVSVFCIILLLFLCIYISVYILLLCNRRRI